MNYRTLLICLGLLISSAWAQPRLLTLDEAVEMAVKKNSSLAVRRYEPELRRADLQTEKGYFDPVFSGTLGYQSDTLGSGQAYGLRLQHRLGQGATYGIEHNSGTNLSGRRANETALKLRVPLLRGAGAHVNRAGINIAQGELKTSQLLLEVEALDLAASVERAYWALAMARQILAVRRRAVTQALAFKELLQKEIDAGESAPFEGFEADQNLASRQADVESSLGDVALAEQALCRLIGLPLQADSVSTSPAHTTYEPEEVEFYHRMALKNRPLLGAAGERQDILKIRNEVAENETKPQLDVVASYALSGQTISPYRWQAGLQLTVPLGNNAARGRLKRAQVAQEQGRAQIEDLRQRVLLETTQAHSLVLATLKQMQAAERASEQAAKRVRAEEARFAAGFTPSHRVIFAQQQQLNTDELKVAALIRHQLAMVELDRAVGRSLEKYSLSCRAELARTAPP